jgi:hypothetical protein
LVQFGTGFNPHASPGEFDASKMHFQAGRTHTHHHNPCTALKCTNQQNFAPKSWYNLEPGSGAMGQLGNMMAPKCSFMPSDHISTAVNPLIKHAALKAENERNFSSKIWFNLDENQRNFDSKISFNFEPG